MPFRMFKWGSERGRQEWVFLLHDGNGDFTREMGKCCGEVEPGFGLRFLALIRWWLMNGTIEKVFA